MQRILLLLMFSSLTACAFAPPSPIDPFKGDAQPQPVNVVPPPILEGTA